MRRNFETILHTIVLGYVWSQRIALQRVSLWDEPYNGTALRPTTMTSDYVANGYKPTFLPEHMGDVAVREQNGIIPVVITPRVRGTPLRILDIERKERNREEKHRERARRDKGYALAPRRLNKNKSDKGKRPLRSLPQRSCKRSNKQTITSLDIMPRGEIDEFHACVDHTPRM